jgi:hypothetical protein
LDRIYRIWKIPKPPAIQKNHSVINDSVKLSVLIETPLQDGRHRQPLQAPKNDFAVNDFAKPFHPFGAHRDAATGTTALGTKDALSFLIQEICSPSFCQKIPFPPFLFERFSDTRI